MLILAIYILFLLLVLWLLLLFLDRELLWSDLILFLILIFIRQLAGSGFFFYLLSFIFLIQLFLTFVVYESELKFFFKNFPSRRADYALISGLMRDFLEFAVRESLEGILVFKKKDDLSTFIKTGEVLHSKVDPLILSQIFAHQSPLRKGAAIIEGDEIKALNCILPNASPQYLSLKKRSALALSQIVDALILVFERGKISLFLEGERVDVTPQRIEAIFKTLNLRNKIKLAG